MNTFTMTFIAEWGDRSQVEFKVPSRKCIGDWSQVEYYLVTGPRYYLIRRTGPGRLFLEGSQVEYNLVTGLR